MYGYMWPLQRNSRNLCLLELQINNGTGEISFFWYYDMDMGGTWVGETILFTQYMQTISQKRIRKVFCFDDCNPILGTKTGMEIPGTYLDIRGKWVNPYFFTQSMKIVFLDTQVSLEPTHVQYNLAEPYITLLNRI